MNGGRLDDVFDFTYARCFSVWEGDNTSRGRKPAGRCA